MPASLRKVTREDLIADAAYAAQRRERRTALLPTKRLRRVALGPYCTFYFETYETLLFQIQEMLLVERGGEGQIDDELDAYNPLIPQGAELVATVMFEIDDERRRAQVLGELGGVEARFFIEVGGDRIAGVPEGDVERTRDDGKTSSVHFLRFGFTPAEIAAFRDPTQPVIVGCDHPRYAHMAAIGTESRAELAKDFAV
jgi:hypothetical protein